MMDIEEEIFIEAEPEAVFAAWTEPQQLMTWWGTEEEFRTVEFVRELQVGAGWRAVFRHVSGQTFGAAGEYRRVDPPTRLSFTWKPDWSNDPPTLIELEFEKQPGGTLLKLKQSGITSEAARAENKAALSPTLGWLKCYLTRKL